MLYERVMLYTHKPHLVKKLLEEKRALGLSTVQLKVWHVALKLITRQNIETLTQLGSFDSRLFGIEQGMLPWGLPWFTHLPKVEKYFSEISEISDYAHANNLGFIIGTTDDPKLVAYFREHGADGVVPNSPAVFQGKPAEDITSKHFIPGYMPKSMKQRLF